MTVPIRSIEALMTGARIYGEDNEPEQEVDTLKDLLEEIWEHLTDDQKELVYCSEAALVPTREMGYLDYCLDWRDPDTGDTHRLGWLRLLPTDDIRRILMDRYWDSRLDATDCQPVVTPCELGWADEHGVDG
jgi:hypothetical protein